MSHEERINVEEDENDKNSSPMRLQAQGQMKTHANYATNDNRGTGIIQNEGMQEIDILTQAIIDEQRAGNPLVLSKPLPTPRDSTFPTHRPQMSSSFSGYDTAFQTPIKSGGSNESSPAAMPIELEVSASQSEDDDGRGDDDNDVQNDGNYKHEQNSHKPNPSFMSVSTGENSSSPEHDARQRPREEHQTQLQSHNQDEFHTNRREELPLKYELHSHKVNPSFISSCTGDNVFLPENDESEQNKNSHQSYLRQHEHHTNSHEENPDEQQEIQHQNSNAFSVSSLDSNNSLSHDDEKKTATAVNVNSDPNRNRTRTSSEEIYNSIVNNHAQQHGLKFYDSDNDGENGSIVYSNNGWGSSSSFRYNHLLRFDAGNTNMNLNRHPTTSMTNGNEEDEATLNEDLHRDRNTSASGARMKSVENLDFPTPHRSNVNGRGRKADPNVNANVDMTTSNNGRNERNSTGPTKNDAVALPYHARRQLHDRQNERSDDANRYNMNMNDRHGGGSNSDPQPRRPKELSTIQGGRMSSSPTNYHPSGLPPSGTQRNRTYSKDSDQEGHSQGHGYHPPLPRNKQKRGTGGNGPQYAQHHYSQHHQQQKQYHYPQEEDFTISRPPHMHLRMESTGSVSSLGSTMDGATTMTQHQTRRIIDHLGGKEFEDYHNQDDSDLRENRSLDLPRRDHGGNKNWVRSANTNRQQQNQQQGASHESSGYLRNFLDSMSVASSGSFRTVEEEKADLHKKSQKILKKKEKLKQKERREHERGKIKGWFADPFGGESSNVRSLSPGSNTKRRHRPKLPSIDNDTWDEDENENSKLKTKRGKSRSRRGPSIRKKSASGASKPPIRKKQGSTSYGSLNERRHDARRRGDNGKYDERGDLKRTNRSSNVRKQKNCDDSSDSSSDDNSCISSESDFTSNQFSVSQSDDDSSVYVDDDESESDGGLSFDDEEENNERTSLLPSGISTDEQRHPPRNKRNYAGRPPSGDERTKRERRIRDDRRKIKARLEGDIVHEYRDSRRPKSKKRHKHYDGSIRRDPYYDDGEYSPGYSNVDSYTRKLLSLERKRMEKRIKKEMLKELEEQRCCNRFGRCISSTANGVADAIGTWLCATEAFISNLPLTIGAVALAVVTLGCVWFKFAEEMLDSCKPVHFHSSQCTFPEFPGCFYCDTTSNKYQMALFFHQGCSALAGSIAMLFILKICIAGRVVMDEMNSPTTSSPAGLMCMTMVCVFAGRGLIGQIIVTAAAIVHLFVAIWFIYMAMAYSILPDPSWYPNTVGIGLSAVKTWLYYPMPGHFLMAISLSLYGFFFPVSLVRVTANKKISAPVCWIQMSAPSISLYALTIMAQPSFEEEHPDVTDFQRVHRMLYLPIMHFLFATAVLGAASSAQSLFTRWKDFKHKPFSPAHAAFCFPTLAHANSVQAYRGAINSFSNVPPGSKILLAIDGYWFFVLIGGTVATFIITAKFFYMLPSWTSVDLDDEIEPPQPHETLMSEVITAGETFTQNFVSPAVLQANEAGALVQIRKDGKTKYVRTRRVTALGFEPIMDLLELTNERDALLDWVEKNPPRTRKRTLSVPGITTNIANFGSNNRGVYTGYGNDRDTATPGSARRRAHSDYNFGGRTPL